MRCSPTLCWRTWWLRLGRGTSGLHFAVAYDGHACRSVRASCNCSPDCGTTQLRAFALHSCACSGVLRSQPPTRTIHAHLWETSLLRTIIGGEPC
eukprot:4494347-Alexandrium_andersonii.AAC.1